MKKELIIAALICLASSLAVVQCTGYSEESYPDAHKVSKPTYGGFDSQEQWGEHLITVSACHDCHSPKKVGARGLELDSSRLLSGYDARAGVPKVNRRDIENKGLTITGDLTSWVGPWGVSYTANITSDETGIGNWTEGQFIYALRNGKYKGMPNTRPLLPPMPWEMYRHMTDDELKAIFAYLKTTKPIENRVPPPVPPAMAAR